FYSLAEDGIRDFHVTAVQTCALPICRAQEIPRIGSPLVQQYTKAAYKAGNQNWAVAAGKNGIMYVANADGLLAFDGQYWTLHPLPNKSTVQCGARRGGPRIHRGELESGV